MTGLKRHIKGLADLLLPRKCIVCGRQLYVDEEHLCLYCQSDIPFTRFWQVKHNAMADRFNAVVQKGLEDTWNNVGEEECEREDYVYASALFFYNDDSDYRHIPHQIKYHGNLRTGRHFGRMLGDRLMEAAWFKDVDMVMPVPLHWRRRWARGYNQAEIIASQVASMLDVPMRTDVLERVRSTTTQTKLDIASKAENVKGAFAVTSVPEQKVRHILLVDDVFTTGATMYSCFSALRQALPSSVRISVATLCFVDI